MLRYEGEPHCALSHVDLTKAKHTLSSGSLFHTQTAPCITSLRKFYELHLGPIFPTHEIRAVTVALIKFAGVLVLSCHPIDLSHQLFRDLCEFVSTQVALDFGVNLTVAAHQRRGYLIDRSHQRRT